MILPQLRAATLAHHERLESRLALFQRICSRGDYVQILERFWGFYTSFEEAVASRPEWQDLNFPFEPRKKSHLLWSDLLNLGGTPESISKIQKCTKEDLPALHSFESILGSLYVLEGSTLGGQIISRHYAEKLGLTRETGLSFYLGYGKETGMMWKTFGDFLTHYINGFPKDTEVRLSQQITQSACECFGAIEHWLCSEKRSKPISRNLKLLGFIDPRFSN